MKNIISTIVLVFVFAQAFAISTPTNTNIENLNDLETISAKKDIRTDTIKVMGNCDMSKARIENAGLIKGVKKITWDKHSESTIVIYDASKTTIDKVEVAIAAVGHDTTNHKADDKVYNTLPKCCQYRGKCCSHKH